jgi:intracellular sulfur oxidation DsrE/DsrF family protein
MDFDMKRKMGYVTTLAIAIWGFSLLVLSPAVCAQAAGTVAENSRPPLQITHQTAVKVVVQVNYSDTIPNGISKQVLAVKNLHDQYTRLGMKAGKDFDIVMVFRADGVQFLLDDAAYDAKVRQPHPKGNPNRAILEALHAGGVTMYQCNVAMKLKGYEPEELLPFSRLVESGIGALVDLEKSGYLSVTP